MTSPPIDTTTAPEARATRTPRRLRPVVKLFLHLIVVALLVTVGVSGFLRELSRPFPHLPPMPTIDATAAHDGAGIERQADAEGNPAP